MDTQLQVITSSEYPKTQVVIIHCKQHMCKWAAMVPTEWQAVHALGEHLIQSHIKPGWTRGQES